LKIHEQQACSRVLPKLPQERQRIIALFCKSKSVFLDKNAGGKHGERRAAHSGIQLRFIFRKTCTNYLIVSRRNRLVEVTFDRAVMIGMGHVLQCVKPWSLMILTGSAHWTGNNRLPPPLRAPLENNHTVVTGNAIGRPGKR
jgi:hypothetical protein